MAASERLWYLLQTEQTARFFCLFHLPSLNVALLVITLHVFFYMPAYTLLHFWPFRIVAVLSVLAKCFKHWVFGWPAWQLACLPCIARSAVMHELQHVSPINVSVECVTKSKALSLCTTESRCYPPFPAR